MTDEEIQAKLNDSADYTARLYHLLERQEFLHSQVFGEAHRICDLPGLTDEEKCRQLETLFAEHTMKDGENWREVLQLLEYWPKHEDDSGEDEGEGEQPLCGSGPLPGEDS